MVKLFKIYARVVVNTLGCYIDSLHVFPGVAYHGVLAIRLILPSLAAITLVINAFPAQAQTATTQFNVQITITAECVINSASNLNFGSSGVIDAAIAATSAISVQCTNATPYDIGLNAGTGTGATVANRLMTGPSAATVSYSLYTDAGHTDVWGNTIGTDTATGTGTGSAQTYTVFGQVLPQQTPQSGVYNDVITVTY